MAQGESATATVEIELRDRGLFGERDPLVEARWFNLATVSKVSRAMSFGGVDVARQVIQLRDRMASSEA